MIKDELKEWVSAHREELDDKELPMGHEMRFIAKLNAEKKPKINWRFLAAAASIALVFSINTLVDSNSYKNSSEYQEFTTTATYYENLIERKIESVSNTSTSEQILNDHLQKLDQLDQEYEMLREELLASPNAQRIIEAIIYNFNTRISLLEELSVFNSSKLESYENLTL